MRGIPDIFNCFSLSLWQNDYLCCTGIIKSLEGRWQRKSIAANYPDYSQEVKEQRVIRKKRKEEKNHTKQNRNNARIALLTFSWIEKKKISNACCRNVKEGNGCTSTGFETDKRVFWGEARIERKQELGINWEKDRYSRSGVITR